MKAWLQVNIPALYVRYTTVMRYKAMAKKGKQDYGTYEINVVAADVAEARCRVGGLVKEAEEGGKSRTEPWNGVR